MAVLISERFREWEAECGERFEHLKRNETEINTIAAQAYGLEDIVGTVPADDRISVRRADLVRELRSLLSYAVGCMFGRYSLDEEGLIFAGGEWDISRYKKYLPAQNGIIFITQEDIGVRLRNFISAAFGEETVDDNMRYIEENLGTDCVRYFRSDFFRDHFTVYHKRPIYWLISSGRRGALRALTYIHRFGSAELELLLHETELRIEKCTQPGQLMELEGMRENLAELIGQGVKFVPDDGVAVNYKRFAKILARADL